MKTRQFFIATAGMILMLFIVTGCTKDEGNPAIDDNKIIGLWELDEIVPNVLVEGKTPEQFLEDELGISGVVAQAMINAFLAEMDVESEIPATIKFNDDGSYTVTFDDDSSDDGDWILIENLLTIDPETSWEKEFTVDLLTDTQLNVHFVDTRNVDVLEDGDDETIVSTINLYYVK